MVVVENKEHMCNELQAKRPLLPKEDHKNCSHKCFASFMNVIQYADAVIANHETTQVEHDLTKLFQ
jgi:hypothetical protein